MSELLWQIVEDRIRRFKEVGMLEWILLCTAARPTRRLYSPGRSRVNKAIRNKLVRGMPASLRSSGLASAAVQD